MTGGFDISLDGRTSADEVSLVLELFQELWPGLVVELGDGTSIFSGEEAVARRWTVPCDFFMYDSKDAQESWSRHGLTQGNDARMVSVNIEPDAISFIINEKDSVTGHLAAAILRSVRRLRAERRATDLEKASLRWRKTNTSPDWRPPAVQRNQNDPSQPVRV